MFRFFQASKELRGDTALPPTPTPLPNGIKIHRKLILEQNVDITCLTEVNKDWRTIAYDNTIWGATTGWREHRRVQVAHNRTVAPGDSEFQVGGSAMLMLGDVTFRISAQGADSRNLGRCSFITLTGKNSITTTIFT